MSAPQTPGNYTVYAEMNQLWEQVFCAAPVSTTTDSYNNCPTFNFVVSPPTILPNSASLSFVSASPSTVTPGGSINFTIKATNTGTNTWVAASNPVPTQPNEAGEYVLSTGILQTGNPSAGVVGGTAGSGGFTLPQSVAPGVTVQVQGSVTAPQALGKYTMYAEMNQLWEQVFCASPVSTTTDSYNNCPIFNFEVSLPCCSIPNSASLSFVSAEPSKVAPGGPSISQSRPLTPAAALG